MTEKHKKIFGKEIQQIDFPAGAIISSIDRNGDIFIPTGSDVIQKDDRITIFMSKPAVRKIEKLINI